MNGRIRKSITGLVLALALVAAGCGDDDAEPEATDLTAIQCPMEQVGEEAGQPQFEPAENAFNTAELIGMELADAQARAAEHDCEIIVSIADVKGQPVPIELNPKAIYVYTEDGVVTEIEGVGGGI